MLGILGISEAGSRRCAPGSIRRRTVVGMLVTFAGLGGPGLVEAANAASFSVTGTADGAGSCSGSSCPTLRAAVAASNAAGGTNTIDVPGGQYALSSGALNVTASVTIAGAGAGSTHIVGSGDRVFTITAAAVTLSGMTVSGGSQQNDGGAVHDTGAALTLSSDTFTGNTTTTLGFGGAVSMDGGTAATLVITNSTFTANIAADSGPSGGGFGGAISFEASGGSVTVTNSTFSSNTAQSGTTSQGGFGGAISFEPSGGATLTVTGSTFNNNTAAGSASPTQGGFGGAIDFEPVGSSNTLNITNSTFTTNQAGGGSGFGGAIDYEPSSGATATLTHVTMVGNSVSKASHGGALDIEGPMTIRNSIVSGNTAAGAVDNCDVSGGGSLTRAGHNIESGTTCGFDLNANPLLGPLASNGGPTETMALLTGSPAIDAAATAFCPATDQRGVARPDQASTPCDIGAFEFVVAKPPPPPPPPPPPHKTKVYKEKLREKKHMITFWFKASGTVKGYQCALRRYDGKKHKYAKLRWARCSSPRAYKHLKKGRYLFEVRGYNTTGADKNPAIKKFTV